VQKALIIDAGVVTAATSITSTEFVGGGVGLTALVAGNITSGGTFLAQNGSALTALNGTQVTTGTLPAARIAADSIVEAKLDVSNGPTNGQFLQAQSGEGGGLTWAAAGGSPQLQIIPAQVNDGNDASFFVPLFKDTTGKPDRCVVVGVVNNAAFSIIEYKLLDNAWVFDPDDCAWDVSVSTNFSCASSSDPMVFAIANPASSGNRVLFIAGNHYPNSPDTFEIDSIVLTPGGSSLSATAVTITGGNQPTDTDGMKTCSIPLSITRVMTFYQDDAHFANITESGGTYTFTYGDAKVLAVDTSIDVDANQYYSGICIGSQVLLLNSYSTATNLAAAWEMNTSASLIQEWNPFRVGLMGAEQAQGLVPVVLTGLDGDFAVASPIGGDGVADGLQANGFIVTAFPLDSI